MNGILHSINGYKNKCNDSDDEGAGYDMRCLTSSNGAYSQIPSGSHSSVERAMHNVDTFDRRLKPNDTLTSLALKYDCKITLLKKVNNLISDQDFHVLKIIKIPFKRHGHISEKFASEIEDGLSPSPTDSLVDISPTLISSRLLDYDPSSSPCSPSSASPCYPSSATSPCSLDRKSREFFTKMDADIRKNMNTAKHRPADVDVSISSGNAGRYKVPSSSSVDWCTVFMFAMCVAVVTPLLYLLYAEYMPSRISTLGSNEHFHDSHATPLALT